MGDRAWLERSVMDSPFTLEEQRFVLAEMVKSSHVDVNSLADFIRNHAIKADWMSMQVPLGRNINQCMRAVERLNITVNQSSHSPASHVLTPPSRPLSHVRQTDTILEAKANSGANGHVFILPRPGSEPVLPVPILMPRIRNEPAKRGRPSKKDIAKRDLNIQLPGHLTQRPLQPISARPAPTITTTTTAMTPALFANQSDNAYKLMSSMADTSIPGGEDDARPRKRKRPTLPAIRDLPIAEGNFGSPSAMASTSCKNTSV